MRKNALWKFLARFGPLIACIAFVAVLAIGTGIIGGWGKWYSPQNADMAQAIALMNGRFDLSQNPADIRVDMLWHGGVQQVWGLGVPLLLLPFYVAANFLGFAAFPDRIALMLLLLCAAWTLSRSLEDFFRDARVRDPRFAATAIAFAFLFFPPFAALLRTRFVVYEETIAFLYAASVPLFALVIRYAHKKSEAAFFGAVFFAGLLPLIRPTGAFYSVPAALVLFWISFRHDRRPLRLALGAGLLVSAAAFLCATNYARFGSVAEFGHSLNLSADLKSIELTRFPTDFSRAPFSAKLAETAGTIFIGPVHDAWSIFPLPKGSLVPFQMAADRWRVFYFRVFDPTYFLLILGCAGLAFAFRKLLRRHSELGAMLLFAAVPLSGLLAFYSYSPASCSRYFVDFAPAFLALLIFAVSVLLIHFSRKHTPWKLALATALIAWFCFETAAGPLALPINRQFAPVRDNYPTLFPQRPAALIPREYVIGFPPGRTNLPFNGSGWRYDTGQVFKVAIFFVSDPKSLTLTLSKRGVSADFLRGSVTAKIGIEQLALKSFSEDKKGIVTIAFSGPKKEMNENGLQAAFIDFTSASSENGKQIFLKKLTWN